MTTLAPNDPGAPSRRERFLRWRRNARQVRDPLTGCLMPWARESEDTVRFVPERLVHWIDRPRADHVFVALDVDGIARLDRAEGQPTRDARRVELARRLRAAAKPWPVFRSGADQFLVVARLPDDEAIRRFVLRLQDTLEQPVAGHPVAVWAGAARWFPGATPLDLLRSLLSILSLGRQVQPRAAWLALGRVGPRLTARERWTPRRLGATGIEDPDLSGLWNQSAPVFDDREGVLHLRRGVREAVPPHPVTAQEALAAARADPALAPLVDRQAWFEANSPWQALPCGHRHRVPLDRLDDHWGVGVVGRTYRVTADLPVRRALDFSDERPAATLSAGSRIRCDAWTGFARGADYWHIFRCRVIDGPQAGTCCLIDDPNPPDQPGWVFHLPGLPPACVPEDGAVSH